MTRLVPRLSAAERTAFIAAARSLKGVAFKHRGRNQNGVDCLGVVAYALTAIGYPPQDDVTYGRRPEMEGQKLRAAMVAHFGDPIPLDRMAPGCIVTMQWHGLVNHVSIIADYYLGGLSLIHALAMDGRVIETRLADPWPRRIAEAWRP